MKAKGADFGLNSVPGCVYDPESAGTAWSSPIHRYTCLIYIRLDV